MPSRNRQRKMVYEAAEAYQAAGGRPEDSPAIKAAIARGLSGSEINRLRNREKFTGTEEEWQAIIKYEDQQRKILRK